MPRGATALSLSPLYISPLSLAASSGSVAPVAQLVEQGPLKSEVDGSSPSGRTRHGWWLRHPRPLRRTHRRGHGLALPRARLLGWIERASIRVPLHGGAVATPVPLERSERPSEESRVNERGRRAE